jgi:mannose-6-phosphate isomerase-like protein (cupin superfamily)
MRDRIVTTAVALLFAAAVHAADPPAKAPAPGSAAAYLSAQQLAEVMKSAIAGGTDPALSQIANTDQYFINEVHRTKAASANVHPGWTEVHIILAGSGTFVTGGTVKTVGAAKAIEGGTSRKVAKGDVIIVPADTPHQYTAIDGSLDAIEVRFISPLEAKPAK